MLGLLAVVLLAAVPATGVQAASVQWARKLGGSATRTLNNDFARSIAVDGTGGQDVFVRKYSLTGSGLWTRQFGTASSDDGPGIAVYAGSLQACKHKCGTHLAA